MASRFERFQSVVERLVYAGLKPGGLPLPPQQTLRTRLAMAVFILLVAALLTVLVLALRHPALQAEKVALPAPPVEIVPKGFNAANPELAVVEIEFNQTKEPKEITGTLHNLTGRLFAKCEVSFNVTTPTGAHLGAVATTVSDVAPHASVRFRIPVAYANAALAMVRELRPE